ncbi:MAG: VWA domain-containing protein [Verrucomicrobiota bacterium]
MINNWIFGNPEWFGLLLLLPLIWWLRSRGGSEVLIIPSSAEWHKPSWMKQTRLPVALIYMAIVFCVLALARPQKVEEKVEVKQEGYDIVLAIDLSPSMLAEDFQKGGVRLNRLNAVRPIIQKFIRERKGDRIGLVVFGGRAYTMAPLTFDRNWLKKQADRLETDLVEQGTAIGDGLALALSRLELSRRDDSAERIGAFAVLLTDGAQTIGALKPEDSAKVAKDMGIPVYTIGVGTQGVVPFPAFDPNSGQRIGTERRRFPLDEKTLKMIAKETGGQYFRARDTNATERAFAAIDKSQKIEFEKQTRLKKQEHYYWFAVPGAILALMSLLTFTSISLISNHTRRAINGI